LLLMLVLVLMLLDCLAAVMPSLEVVLKRQFTIARAVAV
jgi:hypothetical protein